MKKETAYQPVEGKDFEVLSCGCAIFLMQNPHHLYLERECEDSLEEHKTRALTFAHIASELCEPKAPKEGEIYTYSSVPELIKGTELWSESWDIQYLPNCQFKFLKKKEIVHSAPIILTLDSKEVYDLTVSFFKQIKFKYELNPVTLQITVYPYHLSSTINQSKF